MMNLVPYLTRVRIQFEGNLNIPKCGNQFGHGHRKFGSSHAAQVKKQIHPTGRVDVWLIRLRQLNVTESS